MGFQVFTSRLRYIVAEAIVRGALELRRRILERLEDDEEMVFVVGAPAGVPRALDVPPDAETWNSEAIEGTVSGMLVSEMGRRKSEGGYIVAVPKHLRAAFNVYDALIMAAAERHQVPARIIKAVIATESAFRPTARREEPQINDRSRGLMQVLEKTARGLGFKGPFGNLYDPAISIDLGAKLLAQNFKRWGSWSDALAAYNGGRPRKLSSGNLVPILQKYIDKVEKHLLELDGKPIEPRAAQLGAGKPPRAREVPPAGAALGVLALLFGAVLGGRARWG